MIEATVMFVREGNMEISLRESGGCVHIDYDQCAAWNPEAAEKKLVATLGTHKMGYGSLPLGSTHTISTDFASKKELADFLRKNGVAF